MTLSALKERIRELTLRKIRARADATAAAKAATAAEQQPSVDAEERGLVREASRVARQELSEIDGQLSAAREEVRRRECVAQRPAIETRLSQARALVTDRNKLAAEVQQFLEGMNERLIAMDVLSGKLLALERERDPGATGMAALGSQVFTSLNAAMRLRPSLCGALKGTSYEHAVKQPLLSPEEENFAVIEAAAGAKVIGRLEVDLRVVDELSKQEVVA
jgi:hypothetical protein